MQELGTVISSLSDSQNIKITTLSLWNKQRPKSDDKTPSIISENGNNAEV